MCPHFSFWVAVALSLWVRSHLGGPEQLGLELCLENLKYKNSEGKQHVSSQLQPSPHVNLISISRIAGPSSHTSQTPSLGYGLRFSGDDVEISHTCLVYRSICAGSRKIPAALEGGCWKSRFLEVNNRLQDS